MDDLVRFSIGWAAGLAIVAFVLFCRDVARWISARLLAIAVTRLIEAENAPRTVWHVDRDGRVRTDARPIVLRATRP